MTSYFLGLKSSEVKIIDYEILATKYPINGELRYQDGKLKAMDKWRKKTEITLTPTFYEWLSAT